MTECRECGTPLAFDQRYCVACGARRGDLPERIAKILAPLDMPVPPLIAGVPPMLMPPPTSAAAAGGLAAALDDLIASDAYPTPRVAACATIALLAFGVLMGSVIGNGTGQSPIYVMPGSAPAAAVAAAPQQTPAASSQTPTSNQTAIPDQTGATGATGATTTPVAIHHVWLIVLSSQGYAKTFGDPTSQSYLVSNLAPQGAVVPNYYAVAQGQLANTAALVSGQGPTWQQTANCPTYSDVTPGTLDATTNTIQGDGCVYPDSVQTIGDAVAGTGKTWAAYVEDIDNGANGRSSICQQPAAGAPDPSHTTTAGNAYATWANPFMYFKSVAASPNCPYELFGLKALSADLTAGKSAAFSMIIPNRCHDGSDTPCAPGATAGLADSDDFLSSVVPKIMGSTDYQDGGVIAITFDQAPQGGAGADVSGCCQQPAFPNLALPPSPIAVAAAADPTGATGSTDQTGATGATGDTGSTGQAGPSTTLPTYVKTAPDGQNAGGGKVGLLLISKSIKAGNADVTDDYNHYSLLLSIENWFGTAKLGYTSQIGMGSLPDSLFTAGATGATGSAG